MFSSLGSFLGVDGQTRYQWIKRDRKLQVSITVIYPLLNTNRVNVVIQRRRVRNAPRHFQKASTTSLRLLENVNACIP
jgi:hypothetical protein